MLSQSGKVVLILVLILLILGLGIYFFFSFKQPRYTEQSQQITVSPDLHYEVKESSKCELDSENNEDGAMVWEYLPKDLESQTYKKGVVSAGEATYEITPLKSSSDCRYLAFLLELEARDGGYTDKDYQNRGVYIFDTKTKKVITAMLIPKDLLLDTHEYSSNVWVNSGQYKFVLSETVKKGEFIKRRYLFEVENNKLTKSVEEP